MIQLRLFEDPSQQSARPLIQMCKASSRCTAYSRHVFAILLLSCLGSASQSTLVVNLASNTGAISYGASGWLYGQAEDGIPTDNMMAPLKPQVSAQKPPDGQQHPAGDAMHVAPSYKRANGKEIQMYLQDIYPDWPYNDPGIEDYVQKVEIIVRKAVDDPNHALFSYVPFNEPDNNWYGYSGASFQRFLSDWKRVYRVIRAIDPKAKIVGPNYYNYRHDTYRNFLVFARDNNVLPDELSWHELQDNFFPGWYDRYDDYRNLETSLGISPIPIVINEYARSKDDLAVPGKMIQWITRFENSKVQACLAYWVPSGTLSDLVSRTWTNRATGAWWLYKWYAGMTGHTVSLTPPDLYGFGLQGIAALDSSKKQARIIFGGVGSEVDVKIQGFDKTSSFGNSVHVTVWSVASSGLEPSKGPVFEQEADYAPSNGQISVTVPQAVESTAYYIIVTPATSMGSVKQANHYEAEYADLSGSAVIAYGKGTGYTGTSFVGGYRATGNAATEFAVTAPEDGYYDLTLRYATGSPASGKHHRVGLTLNGSQQADLELSATADSNSWNSQKKKFFLAGGINLFSFKALADGSSDGLQIDNIDLTSSIGSVASYEVENPANTLAGTAKLFTDAAFGLTLATEIGGGSANFLQFNGVSAPASGNYIMVVTYTNSEQGHAGQIERYSEISVNGGAPKRVYFRNTFDESVFRTNVVDVELNGGPNTIRFSNPQGLAPDIAKIQIAGP